MGTLSGPELVIILVIVLVLFGGSRLPKLARSLGQAQKEFRSGLAEGAADAPAPDGDAATTDAPAPDGDAAADAVAADGDAAADAPAPDGDRASDERG